MISSLSEYLRLLAISALVHLVACASTENLGTYEESLTDTYVPIKEEAWAIEQADKLHSEFIEEGFLYRDSELEALCAGIASRLLADDTALLAGIDIYIVRSPVPNAMALPNGKIYVHAGLFTVVESEAELAAIIAHEISHVIQRHSVRGVVQRKNTLVTAHIADLATGGFGLAYFPALASITSHSREMESDADSYGLALMIQAGYNPEALVEIFEAFMGVPELKHVEYSIYSSHPSQQSRVEQLQALLAEHPEEPEVVPGVIDPEEFAYLKAQLMEVNFSIRLRDRQYIMAQAILDEAVTFYGPSNRLTYFQGEIYRGMATYPVDAASEKYWIETGKETRRNKYVEEFEGARTENFALAKESYLASLAGDSPQVLSLKRLGQVARTEGELDQAIDWYTRYLDVQTDPVEQRAAQRRIRRLQVKKDKSL